MRIDLAAVQGSGGSLNSKYSDALLISQAKSPMSSVKLVSSQLLKTTFGMLHIGPEAAGVLCFQYSIFMILHVRRIFGSYVVL